VTASYRHVALVLLISSLGTAIRFRDAAAQHLSLRPQIGIYVPTKDLIAVSQTGEVGKLKAGPSFGAALGLRFGSHFGIEATGAYVPTTFSLESGNSVQKQDAKLFLGEALAVLYVLPRTSILNLYLSGGVGVISHGGVAFTSQAKTTDVSGVGGAGAIIPLGGIMLTAGVDAFRYDASYAGSQQNASELKQLDLQLKLGLGFGVGGK
jgi:hypothetical protein